MTSIHVEPDTVEKLRQLDSCSVANAIEEFGVRLRNAGFADSTVRCMFDDFPPMAGYAATVRIRTTEPPMEGDRYFYRLEWLDHVLSVPQPRVLVIEDLDAHPGLGAFIGDVHANVLRALGCAGVVTNGAVRNLEAARAVNFQMFARNVSVSHAFAHVYDFGGPVKVGNLLIHPGDLLHGDRHGVQTVPIEIAPKIPDMARQMLEDEAQIIALSRSSEFTTDKLRAALDALSAKRKKLKQG
jgi:4-hydroxy-4-methyl-2-oxoglutarate aldolase